MEAAPGDERSPPPCPEVLRLFPPPACTQPLRGLYLDEILPPPASPAPATVYANFVSSLDGRIAVTNESGLSHVPDGLTNPRDWRLFRELQAHADCLLTHGGYLRALASGRLGNVMQAGLGDDGGDIAQWRATQGMPEQPAVAILSTSLDLAVPESLAAHGQPVHVLTTAEACPQRVEALRDAGFEVAVTGPGAWVRSRDAVEWLAGRGYRRLYLQTGPRVLASALRERVLSRLYLTISHRLAGGERFDTMVRGMLPGDAGSLRLRTLYLDRTPNGDGEQMFACFEVE